MPTPASSPEHTWTKRRVSGADAVSLAVRERGEPDGPVVVLVHGYPDTGAVWDRVADHLVGAHRVVIYDVRGAGASDRPRGRGAYRIERLAADLHAVIEAVGGGRPVHVAGHDWGSVATWEAVAADGGRIASYTSISGPWLDAIGDRLRRPGDARRAWRQALASWYVGFFHVPLLPALVWRAGGVRGWKAALLRTDGTTAPPGYPAPTVVRDGVRHLAIYRQNITQRLARPRPGRVSVPVQLIVPGRDPFVTPASLEGTELRVPNLRRHDLPDDGHWVVLTKPEAIAGLIAAFVAETEGGPAGRH